MSFWWGGGGVGGLGHGARSNEFIDRARQVFSGQLWQHLAEILARTEPAVGTAAGGGGRGKAWGRLMCYDQMVEIPMQTTGTLTCEKLGPNGWAADLKSTAPPPPRPNRR